MRGLILKNLISLKYICRVARVVKIHRNPSELKSIGKPVLTTGTFDGVHQGHKQIIHRLNEIALRENARSVVLTFSPHPRKVLFPDDETLQLLSTEEEKIALMEKCGVDDLIFFPFTLDFSRISSVEYVRDLLVNTIGVHTMVVGYDHHFGRNRQGDFNQLVEFGATYGFRVEEIPAWEIDQVNVSSTKIRQALTCGEIHTANKYLGYRYGLRARVVPGRGLGRQLGFPTANLVCENSDKLIPGSGVYAVLLTLNSTKYKAMMNIGYRPTFDDSSGIHMEVHIFGLNHEIYGEVVSLQFVERLRSEARFNSAEDLKEQLLLDSTEARKILEKEC
jgi:riboflavin kinase/FMN adenylyltransferase